MKKWLIYWKSSSLPYFLKIVWISFLIKNHKIVSRTSKVTLEILENAIKNNLPFAIERGILKINTILNHKKFDCYLRLGSSDILVFKQIILKNELQPIVQLFNSSKETPEIMLDAGANIGLSSLYFSAYFPNIKIICIEPNKENMDILFKNLGNGNYLILQKALWHEKSFLKENKRNGHWGIIMQESDSTKDGSLESVTVLEVMEHFKLSKIDFLKIDIEGAEEEIFYKDLSIKNVLQKTKCISIEPHSLEFEEFIGDYLTNIGYQVSHSGELVIGYKK